MQLLQKPQPREVFLVIEALDLKHYRARALQVENKIQHRAIHELLSMRYSALE